MLFLFNFVGYVIYTFILANTFAIYKKETLKR